jgi:hypothetical protein
MTVPVDLVASPTSRVSRARIVVTPFVAPVAASILVGLLGLVLIRPGCGMPS